MGEYAVRACVWDRYISDETSLLILYAILCLLVQSKLYHSNSDQLQLQGLMQVQQCGLVSIPCMRKGGLTFGHNVTASWQIPQQ